MKLRRDSNTGGQANCLTIETLSCPVDDSGNCRAYIIRIPYGARNKYIAKGSLWQHIPEFVDGAINHIVNMARALGEQVNGGKPTWPHAIHGHYTDPGENKFEQLLERERLPEDINATHKIMKRIEAEEMGLDATEMVVTSTRLRWWLYDQGWTSAMHLPPIWSKIMRFFKYPHKPTILALSRHDPKTNVTTLLKASGECWPLQEPANMGLILPTLIQGNKDDIEEMSNSSSTVLTTVLNIINKYDLYDQMAYPKHHKQSEVLEIYHFAKTKGDFINPALVEPLGLTLIEATAYGFPIVATENGRPMDIVKVINNGLLIDPHDQKAIADVFLKLVLTKTCEQSRNRHPTTRLEIMKVPEEPMSDSKGCGRSFFKVLHRRRLQA
ncbi:hypothetical protein Pint_06840 [Pistacia integerrima]|uniref:Uncharacterized protein n=1 Tax=Pistacia integerrima TaxID=434235 RepID=A0ACC0XV70_9ROSI|nr:hypothetical protein Pint_06840 [Pistacia integerrima]